MKSPQMQLAALGVFGILALGSSCKKETPTNHRVDDSQCQAAEPPGSCSCSGNCPTPTFLCTTDSECLNVGTNGRCQANGAVAGCSCSFDACITDDECAAGQTCACHDSAYAAAAGNTCVPGNCRVDSDCGADGFCSPSSQTQGSNSVFLGYYCHTPRDLCVNDSDCGAQHACVYWSDRESWQCVAAASPG